MRLPPDLMCLTRHRQSSGAKRHYCENAQSRGTTRLPLHAGARAPAVFCVCARCVTVCARPGRPSALAHIFSRMCVTRPAGHWNITIILTTASSGAHTTDARSAKMRDQPPCHLSLYRRVYGRLTPPPQPGTCAGECEHPPPQVPSAQTPLTDIREGGGYKMTLVL